MLDRNKPEVRIQTSILNAIEKKILIWLSERMPKKINSDHLTLIGFLGALISMAGYMLSNLEIIFLWLASFGLIVNWFGDSLDGTLARVRNAQRPIYGFFIDHNVDALTILVICIGAGLSPFIKFSTAMLILAGYLVLSIYTYINTYLNGEFKITYNKLGPTEFRLVIILINTIFMYFPAGTQNFAFMGVSLSIYDGIGVGVAFMLFIIYLVSFFKDKNKFAKIDPPKF
ncbi:MAG: CDP-alcohol phosphatidyltransferase family protein [Bacteroidales bacterium]|nr:CDP-alcohol phosphatidyltransferase family protein [Bacteroidales bacterium]